ncbi:hypothetical protein ACFQ88_33620 [Paenibacillus sp. NPDC056579]|uniref:hypothetical protein n=1 Tax=Paenibacillus sp. NPDC056579 TaxID=3345871 RepID=UPI0036996BF6
MDWLKEEKLVVCQGNGILAAGDSDAADFFIYTQGLESPSPDGEMSVLAQWLLAPHALYSGDVHMQIPIGSLETQAVLFEQLLPHFSRPKMVSIANEDQEVILNGIRPSSKQWLRDKLQSGEVYPLITDLYRTDLIIHEPAKRLQYYSLYAERLETIQLEHWDELWSFIANTFMARGDRRYILCPTGWHLTDELRHSPTLRALASVPAVEIQLVIDGDDGRVQYIDVVPV